MDQQARDDFNRLNPIDPPAAAKPARKTYVIETTDAEYTFDAEEVHDVVLHESGALVIEGTDHGKTHAFAPGAWVRWWVEVAS